MSNLVRAVKDYESAVGDALKTLSNKKSSTGELMNALLIRDEIARALATHPVTNADTLTRLTEQDRRLKESAKLITKKLGRAVLRDWRELAHREDDEWWWSLDQRGDTEKSWRDLISTVSAWILIALSLSFSLEILRRYLNGGADFTSTVLQGVIALIAGGTIFKGARQFAEGDARAISGYGILSTHKSRWVVVGLLIVFAITLVGTRRYAARRYNDQGEEDHKNKQLTSAIAKFQHSISLEPTFPVAHFNLGNAYEDVLQYDKAINEYTEALLSDQNFYRTYNNLAKLYIQHRKDYEGALKLIDRALTIQINPAEADVASVQYALYKNRGWANMGLKNYLQAHKDLAQALTKRRDGVSVHCLLAQVLEAEQNIDGAQTEWKLCSDLADKQKNDPTQENRRNPDEPENIWVEQAKERLGGN